MRLIGLSLFFLANAANAQVIIFDVPDPLELAHLDAGSVYTDYVQVGRIDAGSIRTDLAEVGILDAGSIYAQHVQATVLDAGSVRANLADVGTVDAGSIYVQYAEATLLDAGTIRSNLLNVGTVDAGTVYAGHAEADTLAVNTLKAGTVDAGAVYATHVESSTEFSHLLRVGVMDGGAAYTDYWQSNQAFSNSLTTGVMDAGSIYMTHLEGDNAALHSLRVGVVDAGSIYASTMRVGQLDAGSIRSDTLHVGTLDAGSMRVDFLQLGTLDAGIAWLAQARNPDGGRLYAPVGLEVNQGERVGFRGPGGDSFIAHTGGVLALSGGAGLKVATVDGFFTQTEATFGQLSANAIQCNGGATNTELSVVAGTGGPSADAGLIIRAGIPNGPVIAPNDAGIWTPAIRLLPWSLNSAPVCSLPSRGDTISVLFPGGLSDGGFDAQAQVCDGDHWISQRLVLGISADAKAGSGPFYRLDSRFPGQVVTIAASVDTAGLGGGSFEVVVRQGGTVFCRGGGTCASASGSSFRMQCFGGAFYVSPDAGVAHAIIAEIDGGCAQTPTLDFAVSVNRFGYPDPGWTAP